MLGATKHLSRPIYLPDGQFCWRTTYLDEYVSEGCTLGVELVSERKGFSEGGDLL